ncbi:RdRP-domain-containing protein [Sistotremastrum niveocremeum HHB9708]|uniref:RNA-dependent RNA polymerase n=2 Tax=Sistotremastraceae TaxID=3402574 RepID=A0A164QW61_9AGAM|nr:RdRP-domain-containing protein [Sistotremastrum niveocremeum HHB9708]KZT39255.1 RdRP-domain-containing protein [Sistotremastrum suecicum HHB10207 ss-3]
MNIQMDGIEHRVTSRELTRALANELHSDKFSRRPRPMNFSVDLKEGNSGLRNAGHGILILPTRSIGERFLEATTRKEQPIKVVLNGRTIRFRRADKPDPPTDVVTVLKKVPWIPPEVSSKREETLKALDHDIQINKVEFGVIDKEHPRQRIFCVEWQRHLIDSDYCVLSIEYQYKSIRIRIGNPIRDDTVYSIVVKFASVKTIVLGEDVGNPYAIFEMNTPCSLESEPMNREIGSENHDRRYRRRLSALDEAHACCAAYAPHLRVVFAHLGGPKEFEKLCKIAQLRPIWYPVSAESRQYFTPRALREIQKWLLGLEFRVGFQCEALLRNGLVTTQQIQTYVKPQVQLLCNKSSTRTVGEILRHFASFIRQRKSSYETLEQCFERAVIESQDRNSPQPSSGLMFCWHVTVTPTAMRLEGPYLSQSNRVLRQFLDFQHHFLRVDFREEDGLLLRWDRKVDAREFVAERVGGLLCEGFSLAGRHFEFLAYSSSSLREHAVWFVHRFKHPILGWVSASTIRQGLGNFSQDIRCPARFAARMAQAFTATDPSITVCSSEWQEIQDVKRHNRCFTDGVGTMSGELASRIWESLLRDRHRHSQSIPCPSAFQVRIAGYKGVIALDPSLKGTQLCLRKSMKKFEVESRDLPIEIVQAFKYPGKMFLNRPLIMILEDLGVPMEIFLGLQKRAISALDNIDRSVDEFRKILWGYGLGSPFRLGRVLQHLQNLGLSFDSGTPHLNLQDSFIKGLIGTTKVHILRELKHRARIPVPDAWKLVGVADEGFAHKNEPGVKYLRDRQVFVCVRNPETGELEYPKGRAFVSRSPTVHPGDVQMVWAMGKPDLREGERCYYHELVNCLVFSCDGPRPLPSFLGGGDLDGDLFEICFHSDLLIIGKDRAGTKPAAYDPIPLKQLDYDSKIEDIVDFVVDYFVSDVLGLLSNNHLIIADQSALGVRDPKCLKLAEMCSQAVDFPKTGQAVDLTEMPRRLIPYTPDWNTGEVSAPRSSVEAVYSLQDFYESTRAIGYLYRAITIEDEDTKAFENTTDTEGAENTWHSVITPTLRQSLEQIFSLGGILISEETRELFRQYQTELKYIAETCTVSTDGSVRLSEEEIMLGTILGNCSQPRLRKDKVASLRDRSQHLVELLISRLGVVERSRPKLQAALKRSWAAWCLSGENGSEFGGKSFGFVALGHMLHLVDTLRAL